VRLKELRESVGGRMGSPIPFGTGLDGLRIDDAEFMGHVTSTVN
jgi:hypothetical protein